MKYLVLIFCLLASNYLHAQQAKAYEIVHYKAESQGYNFSLDYADGYLAASIIKVKHGKVPVTIFQPASGVTDSNGKVDFKPLNTAINQHLILQNIDETSTAPTVIKAIYTANRRKISLHFIRLKR